jgi:replicative DNA helicase
MTGSTGTRPGTVDERATAVYRRQVEAAAIGGLILKPGLLTEVSRWLQPDDFHNPVYAAWYTLLLELHDTGQPVDQITLLAALRRTGRLGHHGQHGVELATITEHVPLPNAAASYCREVLHESIRRRLADTGIRLTQLATSTGGDTTELLDQAATRLTAELQASARRLRLAQPAPPRPAPAAPPGNTPRAGVDGQPGRRHTGPQTGP